MSMINFIVAHLHQVLWMSCSMIYLTCIKLSVILRLAKNYAITRLVILMKMIYRSDMSKIYADIIQSSLHSLSHAKRRTSQPQAWPIDASTLQTLRPTATGMQTTSVKKKQKKHMSLTFFTHLDAKRPHLWTRHLDQNRLTLPFLFTLPRFSVFNSKTRSRQPQSFAQTTHNPWPKTNNADSK